VGGGVRSLSTALRLLELGVHRVIVGTKLVQDSLLAGEMFRVLGERVVAGIDCRGGTVSVQGWTESSEVSATSLARQVEAQGAKRLILTDISRDGMLTGPNLDLIRQVTGAVAIPVIASGGIGSLEHIQRLRSVAPEGVIIGRALYEGAFSLAEAVSLSKET
jgi:phosphoribosylformimino-5-aminoimidazole carboxamide ribotide isomerase